VEEKSTKLDRDYFDRRGLPPVTLGQLIRHAERYGSEGVYETGEVYLVGSELAQLDAELTRLDSSRNRRFQQVPARKRMSTQRKMETILFLDAEGVANDRIADRLGPSKRQFQRLRTQARKALSEAT
jgi:hypothetical protein